MTKKTNAKVSCTIFELVWFDIVGEYVGQGYTRRDPTNVVGAIVQWQLAAKISPVFSTTTGGGRYHAGFLPEDADKFRTWLEAREDVVEVPDAGGRGFAAEDAVSPLQKALGLIRARAAELRKEAGGDREVEMQIAGLEEAADIAEGVER